MNPVYIRVALYFLAPIVGMFPGVTYLADAQQIIIDLEAAAMGLAGSAVLTAGIFAKWGKK
jgi:hypothetical protein